MKNWREFAGVNGCISLPGLNELQLSLADEPAVTGIVGDTDHPRRQPGESEQCKDKEWPVDANSRHYDWRCQKAHHISQMKSCHRDAHSTRSLIRREPPTCICRLVTNLFYCMRKLHKPIWPWSSRAYLDRRVFMDGSATPSARPKRMRTVRSIAVECSAANGVRNVARDHTATPHAMTLFPPYLSARAPPAMDETR